MSYVDQNGTGNRATAAIGVIAIHVALGGLVITGLSTVVPMLNEEPNLESMKFKLPPPPPTEPPETPDKTIPQKNETIFTPDPPFKLPSNNASETTTEEPDESPFVYKPDPDGAKVADPPAFPKPKPTPVLDPIIAKPSNDPSAWVTNSDYRTIWIRREYQGTVGFSLSVGTSGRVENCRITRSSGHGELDDATCRLIKQRARFTSARDGKGMKVPGTYSNSVRWQLPD
ncbi:MAG: TonB family protein [Sphingomonadaceae bacterium]|nr:TonB family protein [Sphingomonadaceae bacterium]MCP5384439.1 TonB family protein [Altererythrobacter sp.]MCP5390698.1 TonB family protein [Sphingomonadaceae bacterium]MCP5393765.1 TonB family protein [Sphingomonadaceae bacterium]